MENIIDNNIGIYANCKEYCILDECITKTHCKKELFCLIYVQNGLCSILEDNFTFSLKNGELIFFNKKCDTVKIQSSGIIHILNFTIDENVFDKLNLDFNTIYSPFKININELLNDISYELSENNDYSNKNILSFKILSLFTEIAKSLYSITIPAEIIGKEGFSVKNVATRKYGYFLGRNCIKIEPNREMNNIIVLENFDLYDYKIDLKEIKFVKLNYYLSSKSQLRNPVCRLRFLCARDENKGTVIFQKNISGHPEFFAPLQYGKWTSTIFSIKLEGIYHNLIEHLEKAYLVQMKIDPFGIRNPTEINVDEEIYISSVTFYKKLPFGRSIGISPDERINSVIELINQNLSQNFDIKYYADKLHISPSHFSEWFKAATGVSPHKYILIKKIRRAQLELEKSNTPIKAIADMFGFNDTHYFSRIFTKYSGMTPSQYRKNSRKT